MRVLGLKSARTNFPWVIFLFLFAVFALSSWKFYKPTEGYYAEDAYQISETARTGSLQRQIGLTSLGVFAALSLLRKTRSRVRINGCMGVLFLLYIGWTVMSIIWTVDMWLTVKGTLRFVLMCLGALAIAKTLSMRETVLLTFYTCILTLLISVVIELSLGTFNPFDASWRLSGVMHPVSQGWNCSLLGLSALLLSRNEQKSRSFYFGVFVIGLFFLLLSKSRMAVSATILSIIVYCFLTFTRSRKVALLILSTIFICLTYFILGDEIATYSAKIASFGRGSAGQESINTLTGRIPLWEECLRYASRSPIWGYGYNAFLTPRYLLNISESAGWMSSPHSGYIGTLLELGIIGVIFLVLTLGTALKLSIDMLKRNPDYVFSVCILVWLIMNLLLESFLLSSPFFPTFLALILLAKLSFINEPLTNIGSASIEIDTLIEGKIICLTTKSSRPPKLGG